MSMQTFLISLEKAFMISPKVKHFIFHINQAPPFHYIPGQFITIQFTEGVKLFKRSYSIANPPIEDNRIEFAAGYVAGGPATELLFNLNPGDCLQASGPFGRLTLKDELPKRIILVATSTGITPYRAMITELKRRLASQPDLQVIILQGVQKHEDILYPDDFFALTKAYPQIKFQVHLSREAEANLRPYEALGYVQHAFPSLALNPAQDLIYLCGNPSMIDDSFSYLKEQGFSVAQIIREKYISAPGK